MSVFCKADTALFLLFPLLIYQYLNSFSQINQILGCFVILIYTVLENCETLIKVELDIYVHSELIIAVL